MLFTSSSEISPLQGRRNEVDSQTSKGWFALAIFVGMVVVIGAGGFGAVGLLQSHGIISLPKSLDWLASAIGTVGKTSHFWSLWTITASGPSIGSILIAFGSFKIYKANFNPKKLVTQKKEVLGDQPPQAIDAPQRLQEAKNAILDDFGDKFDQLELKKDDYNDLPEGRFRGVEFTTFDEESQKDIPEKRVDRYVVVINYQGTLMCTGRVTYEDATRLKEHVLGLLLY